MNTNAPGSDHDQWVWRHIGAVLRELREAQDKTLDNVASLTGLSRNGVHLIETGSNASIKNVELIAEKLGSSFNIVAAMAEKRRQKK